jgi:hypothetical protein
MFTIPRRYSHFIFGVIQSGLTFFYCRRHREPFRDRNRPFPVELARLMVVSWAVMSPVVLLAAPITRSLSTVLTREEPTD